MAPWDFNYESNKIEEKRSILRTSELKNYISTVYYCENLEKYQCPAIRKIEKYRINNRYRYYLAYKHFIDCAKYGVSINANKIILNIYNDNIRKSWEIKRQLKSWDFKYQTIRYIDKYPTKIKNKKENIPTQRQLIEKRLKFVQTSNISESYIFSSSITAYKTKILVSTKKLLKYLNNTYNVHLNITYKVLDIGNSILVLGISNLNKMFIPVVVGILQDKSESSIL
ncbi:hypothetical protein BB559_002098 [Furculomyces boomerangus]|uniref:Uncharacterized protein n=2 Tax=Harpellales TaxID=61421 RepID=A0A2T9YY60_9FUNG|nr:hypothetical protein BB559_002098 [Furculomyces boomerangus]PWA02342.1 hypothetical protein BB558_001541 [Smittium angustum]